jgi:hypothetical protein
LRRCRKITGPGELSLTPMAMNSISGAISTRMIAASTTSLTRLASSLVPVNGVSQMPTTGMPFMSWRRPWMMLIAEHVGHEVERGGRALQLLEQVDDARLRASGRVM